MKESNDKKWTVAEVLASFGQRQAQVQQEKMLKQQLKDALMQNQAQGLSQFIPGMQEQVPMNPEQQSFDEYYQQAKRGGIHIDPRKKGTFKAQATRMGMSIQQAAAHILANKKDYSPAMVKKANFARNFAKEEGGELMFGNPTSPEEWGKQIKEIEAQIGNPSSWSLDDYNLLQNKLYEYKNWRENTPEGRAVKDSHNVPGEYDVPLPEHLRNYTNTMMKSKFAYANEFGVPAANMQFDSPADAEFYSENYGNIAPEFKKGGQMIRRADGSYSQRGLWDNIRANRGSGKKPTKEMLKQERKIKRKYADGGTNDCPEGYAWSEEYQMCAPVVDEAYAKDFLTDWYSRRGQLVNDPNFGTLEESPAYSKWLGKVLPMINTRMQTSNVSFEYPEVINDDPNAAGVYQFDKTNPKILIANSVRQNPFNYGSTMLHEYTTESTAGNAEKFVEPTHQFIIEQNIKPYEEFLATSPMAEQVKKDKDLEEQLYNDYLYSTGQTPEGQGNMHSYVMNWRKTFNMDPTKVYTEQEVADMVAQAEQAGMLTKGNANFNDDLYRLYRLAKDNKALTNFFNLMANNTAPNRPSRLNDDIQYAKYGGDFGYMPNFF